MEEENGNSGEEHCSARSWKRMLKSIPVPVWEALVLTPVLLIIIGLFMLPTVFYALPSKQVYICRGESGKHQTNSDTSK